MGPSLLDKIPATCSTSVWMRVLHSDVQQGQTAALNGRGKFGGTRGKWGDQIKEIETVAQRRTATASSYLTVPIDNSAY